MLYEVITDLTFAATINAILYTKATPVIVDVEEESWCIDPKKIEEAITPETKAIIPRITSYNVCYTKLLRNMIIEYTRILETIGSIHIFDNRNQIIDFFNYSKNKYIIFPYDYNPKLPLERIANDKKIHPSTIYSDNIYLHSKEGEDVKYFNLV